jgi:hypothetical protein
MTITVLTYSLWIFQVHASSSIMLFTILPFSLTFFLYSWLAENGDAESPEQLIFENKILLFVILSVCFPLIFVFYK